MLRQTSSSDGQSVEVPSKGPETVSTATEAWRSRYEELERIDDDRGGYGMIFRVRERTSGRELALKQLRTMDRDDLSRFKLEIQQQHRLRESPYVMPVIQRGDDLDWYVMPLAEASLTDVGPELSDDEIGAMLSQVATGLGDAHLLDILHRDVKPSNILLMPRLVAGAHWMVSDFGLARAVGHARSMKTTKWVGTPGFIAPEILFGTMDAASPASDVYGLGRTLVWLTTGKLPSDIEPMHAAGIWRSLAERMTERRHDMRIKGMEAVIFEVQEILRALRRSRKSRWGTQDTVATTPSTIGWREDRVLWTLFNGEFNRFGSADVPSIIAAEIDAGDLLPAEIRGALTNLMDEELVEREVVDGDPPQTFWRVSLKGARYATEHLDRLVAAFRGDGGDRPSAG